MNAEEELDRLAKSREWPKLKERLIDPDVFVEMVKAHRFFEIWGHWRLLKHHQSLTEEEVAEALASMVTRYHAKEVKPEELADFQCEVSFLLTGLSCHSHAERVAKQALDILREAGCRNTLIESKAWLAFAYVSCERKQVDDALIQLKIAFDLYNTVDKSADRDVEPILFSLSAKLAFGQGKWDEVVAYAEKAIAAREKISGPDARQLLGNLYHLGFAYVCQDRGTEAESAFSRGVAIAENHFGLAHPDVATFQERLAWAYCLQNKFSPARELYEKVITTLTDYDATDDLTWLVPPGELLPTVLMTYAGLLMDYGEYAGAERRLHQCLFRANGLERDASSLVRAGAWGLMGELLFRQGRYQDADRRCSQAIELLESNTDWWNVHLVQPLLTRGKVCLFRGDLPAAKASLQRGLEIVKQWFHTDHREQIKFHAYLSDVNDAMDEHEEAAQHIARILEIEEKHGTFVVPALKTSEEIESLDLRIQLCRHYLAMGRNLEAEAIYKQNEERLTSIFKNDTGDVAHRRVLLVHLVKLYEAFGRLSDAERCILGILEIQEKTLGGDHPDLAPLYGELAEICAAQQKYSEAVSLLRQAANLRNRIGDSSDLDLIHYLIRGNELSMKVREFPRGETLAANGPCLPASAPETSLMKVKPGWYDDLAQLMVAELHPGSIDWCRRRFLGDDFLGSDIEIVRASLCKNDPQAVLNELLAESGSWRLAEKLGLTNQMGQKNACEVVLNHFDIRCFRPMSCIEGLDAIDGKLKKCAQQILRAPDKATLKGNVLDGLMAVEGLLDWVIRAWSHLMFPGEGYFKLTELLDPEGDKSNYETRKWSFGDVIRLFQGLPTLLDSSSENERERIKVFFAGRTTYITTPRVATKELGEGLELLVATRNKLSHLKKLMEVSLTSLQKDFSRTLKVARTVLEKMDAHHAVPRTGSVIEERQDRFRRRSYTFLLDDQSERQLLFHHLLDWEREYVIYGLGIDYGAKDPLIYPVDEVLRSPWHS
jgi:tetratricopeptide (TPR) repeat protein